MSTTKKTAPARKVTPFQRELRALNACSAGRRYVGRSSLRGFWARSLKSQPDDNYGYRHWLCFEYAYNCMYAATPLIDRAGDGSAASKFAAAHLYDSKPPFTLAQLRKARLNFERG